MLNFNFAAALASDLEEVLGECMLGMVIENRLLSSGILTLRSSVESKEDPEEDGVRLEFGLLLDERLVGFFLVAGRSKESVRDLRKKVAIGIFECGETPPAVRGRNRAIKVCLESREDQIEAKCG